MEKILLNAMLSSIQKEIIENKEEIENVSKIDKKYCKIKVRLKTIIDIIENYKNKDINFIENEVLVYCNGNPYIVLNLIMIAICGRISIKINIDETMVGVNTLILKIINNVLDRNKINLDIKFVKEIDTNNIVFIDRVNDYNVLKEEYKNAKFIPYESLDVYCDTDDYDELFDKIYEYAVNMNIDIDVFEREEGIDSVYKFGKSAKILILTNDKSEFIKLTDREVYVNENPFKNSNPVFSEEMIKKILILKKYVV